MKVFLKTKNRFTWCISFAVMIFMAACTLPEVTPPVETATPTEPSFIITNTQSPSPTNPPIPEPVEITARNAASLIAINRAPVNSIQQIAWSEDGLSLAVSTQNTDSTDTQLFGVSVLEVPSLTPINIMSTKDGRVSDISSDGKLAALVSLDMTTLSLVDLTAENSVVLTITPDFLISNATFSPNGATLAIAKMDEWMVTLYSTTDGSEVNTLTGFETAAPVYNAGFTQSPQWILWHARATLQLQEIVDGNFAPSLDHQDFVTSVAMTRDGSMLASNASTAGHESPGPAVTLWDAAGGNVLRTLELNEPALCIEFSPNGTLLAMGVGSTLQIWDVTSGSMLASLEGHAGQVTTLAFSADGKYIASAGNDNQLFLWQVSE